MEKRAFLKLAGAVSGAALIPTTVMAGTTSLSIEADALGKRFRGTQDGKILMSGDAGKSWTLHADFGAGFAVKQLTPDARGGLRARLSGSNTRIDLALNARADAWMTA